MCLITLNTPHTNFSDAWLLDFYDHNQDGLGVMYAENSELVIEKFVPKTEKAVLQFYNQHIAGKHAVVHWRMKTHGKIDIANAHPYEVLNKAEHGLDVWMVHNGILSGVKSDQKAMSDTWHFIRDTIRPLLAENAALLHHPAFIKLLEDRIGSSNKLVFLDNLGRQTVINSAAFHDFSGAKLSNTYAWSSHSKHNTAFPEDYLSPYGRSTSSQHAGYGWNSYTPYQGSTARHQASEEQAMAERTVYTAYSGFDDLEQTVYENPEAVACLLQDYGMTAADIRGYLLEEPTV